MHLLLLFLGIIAPASIMAVDGGWGPWKILKQCTKPCGGGITAKLRRCNKPPPSYDGKDCRGRAEYVGPCNTHRCPIKRGTPVVCEGGTMRLSCPYNMKIDITWALYGRKGRRYCDHWLYHIGWNKNCRAGSSLSTSRRRCNGRNKCNLPASNSVFGDPCRHTQKYLRVTYQCV